MKPHPSILDARRRVVLAARLWLYRYERESADSPRLVKAREALAREVQALEAIERALAKAGRSARIGA